MKYIILNIAIFFLTVYTISSQVKVSGHLVGGYKQNISLVVNRYPAIFDQTILDSQTDEMGILLFLFLSLMELSVEQFLSCRMGSVNLYRLKARATLRFS